MQQRPLSGIAATHLDDPGRWPQIYALNRAASFPDVGGRLTDPDLIYPGWRLQLPDTDPPGNHPLRPAVTTSNQPPPDVAESPRHFPGDPASIRAGQSSAATGSRPDDAVTNAEP